MSLTITVSIVFSSVHENYGEVPLITYIRRVMKKPLQNTLHKGYNWLISLDLTTSKTKTFTDNSNAMSKNVIYITM